MTRPAARRQAERLFGQARCHKTPQDATILHKTPQDVTKLHKTPQGATPHISTFPNLGTSRPFQIFVLLNVSLHFSHVTSVILVNSLKIWMSPVKDKGSANIYHGHHWSSPLFCAHNLFMSYSFEMCQKYIIVSPFPPFPWRTIEIPRLQFKCCWSEPEVGLSGRNWPKVALSGRNWFLQRMQLRGWQTECYLLHQVEPIFTFPYSYLYLLSHLIYVFVTCYYLWCMFVFAIFNVGEISSDLYRYHVVTF